MPPTKSLRSGTWASTLLPRSRSACVARPRASRAVSTPKNSTSVRTPFSTRDLRRTFAAGSMPSTGMPRSHEVLQQVAVVAGELDDLAAARRARSARSSSRRSAAACSSQRASSTTRSTRSRRRSRSGVSYSSSCTRKHSSQTSALQRIERLHRGRALLGREVGVRQRRHAEVGEDVLERGAAEAARRRLIGARQR